MLFSTFLLGMLIEEYGDVGLFNFNANLSFGTDILQKSKMYEVWAIDINYEVKLIPDKRNSKPGNRI